jgi:predicted phosphodiesterase
MKIGIMSDLHMYRTVLTEETPWDFEPVEGVFYICAGDICEDDNSRHRWVQKHAKHMFVINGNHDYYGGHFTDALYGTKLLEVNGITIAGATLWTDLSNPLDWYHYVKGLIDCRYIQDVTQDAMMETHEAHKHFLFNSEADIIVSHHTPSFQSVHEKYRGNPFNTSFSNNLDEQILTMKKPPKLWIHGHTHDRFDYMIGQTRVICHPRGYKNELDDYMRYKPLIVEI